MITGNKSNEKVLEEVDMYPQAPSQREVLKDLFEDFADSLPKKGLFD